MNRIRHIAATVIAGLLAVAAGVVALAPDAFAARVALPAGGGPAPVSTPVIVNSGMAGWEISLIALAAALAAAAITAAVLRLRTQPVLRLGAQ